MAEAARRGPMPPIPLTVLTGFLGAGKTTLLNRLLQDPALADTVVIVNEFGEIGLDHLLVETLDRDLILLSAGCLCCTVRGDLIATLEDLLRRRDNGRIPEFRRVVVETTGLADPAPIIHALVYHPYLAMRYALAEVVTVVDAANGPDTLDRHPEAVKQAAVADRIVLTKSDLVGAEAAAALEARLARLNPAATLMRVDHGEARADDIVGHGLFDLAAKGDEVRAWLGAEAVEAVEHTGHGAHVAHAHGHAHSHAPHDRNRHDERIRAFALASEAPIPPPIFEMFLDLLRGTHGPKLLRVKGLVALSDDPKRPVVIHGVQHVFHPPKRLPAWPDADRRSRLVFIVDDLDPAVVERLWDAFLGRPRVDAPDVAALFDNPLSLRGGG